MKATFLKGAAVGKTGDGNSWILCDGATVTARLSTVGLSDDEITDLQRDTLRMYPEAIRRFVVQEEADGWVRLTIEAANPDRAQWFYALMSSGLERLDGKAGTHFRF